MATEKQLQNLAKAREAKKQTGTSGGAGAGFENPQQLGQQAGELWMKGFNNAIQSGLRQTLGSFKTQNGASTGSRGGTSAQHAQAGRKGGKASGGGGQSQASTG